MGKNYPKKTMQKYKKFIAFPHHYSSKGLYFAN